MYISAGAPDSNQPFNEWWKGYPGAPGAAEIKPDRMALTLEGFQKFFAQDLATDEIELLYCLQGPYASVANDDKIKKAAWKDKPSWFIFVENDQMLLKELERDSAVKLGAKSLVLPSSHVPMLSHPAEVANFIESAAREMGEASS